MFAASASFRKQRGPLDLYNDPTSPFKRREEKWVEIERAGQGAVLYEVIPSTASHHGLWEPW